MAILKGIAFRNKKKAEMMETDAVVVTPERGVEGCYRGKPSPRQVTVMSVEDWRSACAELNADLHWTTRRANLLVEDISFDPASVGSIIEIGKLRMEITIETDPCSRMEQAHKGLLKALMPDWRGGACCRVLSGGEIKVGDSVRVVKS